MKPIPETGFTGVFQVTIEELADTVKLNKSSVSRILNGKGQGHSLQTQKRVREAATALGYRPDPTARALATGATQIIEIWITTQEDYSPYFGYLHHCLHHVGIAHGYRLIAEDVRQIVGPQGESSYQARWPVDGIINCDLAPESELYRRLKANLRVPIVNMGQGLDPLTDHILLDVYAGAQEAVRHLLSAGCKRLALVRSDADARDDAYMELVRAAGIEIEVVVALNHSRAAGTQAMLEYVRTFGCPESLFCVNDELAIGCYLGLLEMGLRVPEDVLLVGFDGLENARLFPCPISSVVVPIEEMCHLAWELLVRRLSHPETPFQQRILVPHLEIRASSQR